MTAAWAVRLAPDRAAAAGPLRLRAGLRGHLAEDGLWVRGEASDEALDRDLRKLGVERYVVGPGGSLTRAGDRVPCGALPDAEWLPLARVLAVAPPPAALPGLRPAPAAVRIVRGGASAEANVLLTPLATWAAWAGEASQARLRGLLFAANPAGRALVFGSPLPPLPGERFVASGGIAVPCGWEWRPRVGAAVLAAALGVADGDLAFLGEAGGCRLVRRESFVAASRSAARLTLAAAGAGGEDRRGQ